MPKRANLRSPLSAAVRRGLAMLTLSDCSPSMSSSAIHFSSVKTTRSSGAHFSSSSPSVKPLKRLIRRRASYSLATRTR